jgi:predicted ATPase
LLTLTPASQELLVRAACIGHQFDLATLAMIVEHNPGRTMRDLWQAIQVGLVQQQGTFQIEELFVESGMITKLATYRFRFVHDRVQQAAYELLPASKTAAMHLQIGRLWLRQRNVAQTDEFLFAVANQFHPALDLVQDPNERTKLALLHLQAGKKAIASTAFASALRYLENGLILLHGGDWKQQYELTLALSLERAECEYLNHQAETAMQHFKVCLQHARTPLEKAMIHLKQVDLYGDDHQHAVAEGLAGAALPYDCLHIHQSFTLHWSYSKNVGIAEDAK